MRILGLDPGSQCTGFGIIDWVESQPVHVSHGVFTFGRLTSLHAKLACFYQELTEIFREHRPQAVSVEQVFLGKNPDSAFKLGHMRAIGLLVAEQNQCSVAQYAARTVKKVVTGHGGAEKEHVRSVVLQLLNIQSSAPMDASDALAIAICHGYRFALADVARRLQEVDL